jgi:coenzyme PQQ precursor peptide PqqA
MAGPLAGTHAAGRTWAMGHPCPTLRRPVQRNVREGDTQMTWQTPQASDFRFGFEITMYVAAR